MKRERRFESICREKLNRRDHGEEEEEEEEEEERRTSPFGAGHDIGEDMISCVKCLKNNSKT